MGGDLDDRIHVSSGANIVQAKAGNDYVSYFYGGANRLDGGAGEDTLTVVTTDYNLYFIVNVSDGSVDDGQLSIISGFEHYEAIGGNFDDIASFDGGNDSFFAKATILSLAALAATGWWAAAAMIHCWPAMATTGLAAELAPT